MDWLGALPERHVVDAMTLVHGSPRDPTWEYVTTATAARANLDAFTTSYLLHGHTHVPIAWRAEPGHLEVVGVEDGSQLELDGRRMLLNPGSVGQPRDGDPRASALVVDTEARTVTWRRIAYPISEVQADIRDAGLPKRLAERLAHGR
jgi:diadenosine tetraphosphatase ApaH/serine/threonine PP2A family protein phosphatase